MEPSDLIACVPATRPKRGGPVLERLLWRLKIGSPDVPPCSFDPAVCWPWPGARNDANYGRYGSDPEGETYVHRGMYREVRGPIPEGHEVEHTCHSNDPICEDGDDCEHRPCANPWHGEATSRAENHRRRRRDVLGKLCEAGKHPFEPMRNGNRRCRLCNNECMAEVNRARRANRRTLVTEGGGSRVERSGGVAVGDERRYQVLLDGELVGAVESAREAPGLPPAWRAFVGTGDAEREIEGYWGTRDVAIAQVVRRSLAPESGSPAA